MCDIVRCDVVMMVSGCCSVSLAAWLSSLVMAAHGQRGYCTQHKENCQRMAEEGQR